MTFYHIGPRYPKKAAKDSLGPKIGDTPKGNWNRKNNDIPLEIGGAFQVWKKTSGGRYAGIDQDLVTIVTYLGLSMAMGVPNSWMVFVRDNPIKMDDDWGYPKHDLGTPHILGGWKSTKPSYFGVPKSSESMAGVRQDRRSLCLCWRNVVMSAICVAGDFWLERTWKRFLLCMCLYRCTCIDTLNTCIYMYLHIIWFNKIWHDMVWYDIIWHNMLKRITTQYDVIQYDLVRFNIVQDNSIRYNIIQYDRK